MGRWYPFLLLLHLSSAIVFVGAVAFEVFILDALHRTFDQAMMGRVERAVMERARRVMPWVVMALYASGIAMFTARCTRLHCLHSHFGWLLLGKVMLALGVLTVFIRALRAKAGRVDPCRYRRTHRIVLVLMAGIVILAKTMFYF